MNLRNLHQEVLEELLQLPLSRRVGEVTNIESSTFGRTSQAGIIFFGTVRLVLVGSGVGRIRDGGISHSGGDFIDGVC